MGEGTDRPLSDEPSRVGLAVGLACGVPVMAVGVIGLWRHMDATPPANYLKFLVGGDVVHDFVVAPIVAMVAFLVLRRANDLVRPPLRAALFASAITVAIAWPALRMYGRMRTPDNTSVQPLDYATAVATVLAVVWLLAAVWFAITLFRSARRRRRAPHAQAVPRPGS